MCARVDFIDFFYTYTKIAVLLKYLKIELDLKIILLGQ